MNSFKRIIQVATVTMALLMLWACSSEEPSKYKEGEHYNVYENAIQDQFSILPELDGANVIEFFSYGCMHCQKFAPKLKEWQKKTPYSSIAYVPAIWDEQTELYAQIYYIIQGSPNFDDVHLGLFELVGGFSRTDSLDDRKVALIEYLHGKGFQPIDVVNAINENAKEAELAAAVKVADRFEMSGTPTIVMNGKQKIDNRSIQSFDELLDMMSELAQTN